MQPGGCLQKLLLSENFLQPVWNGGLTSAQRYYLLGPTAPMYGLTFLSFLRSYSLTFLLSYVLTLLRSYCLTFLLSYVLTLLRSYSLTFLLSYILTVLRSYCLTFLRSYALQVKPYIFPVILPFKLNPFCIDQ